MMRLIFGGWTRFIASLRKNRFVGTAYMLSVICILVTLLFLVSPGDFPLLTEATYESMEDHSVLFMVGRDDNVLYDTRRMFERTTGEAAMVIYNSVVHGSAIFTSGSPHLIPATRLVLRLAE